VARLSHAILRQLRVTVGHLKAGWARIQHYYVEWM
jgi:hypothetical protein